MFWADEICDQIRERFADKIAKGEPLLIHDEKTLSGRVHVGSLRGVVIHGILSHILTERGVANRFKFELNDNDPMDGLPIYVDQKTYREHMGKPLFAVPALNKGEENFTTGFGEELKEAVQPLHLPIEWYTLRPLYREGMFNDTIVTALENADKIRHIYLEVSGGEKPDDWYPLNVVCEKCGKIGTTKVTGWDGTNVTYRCMKEYVEWAEGCGHEGSMSPFDGNATLPWKVEWAAKWKVLGVDVEAAGKDHYASGGSREISARISEEIYQYPEPFGFLYEFLNFKGQKMSASKGLGATAKEMADLLPPHLLRFIMIRKEQNQPIDFDPRGKTIPNLFDEYDRCSDHYFKRVDEPFEGYARAFELAQPGTAPEDLWTMRFQALSFVVQMPHLNIEEEAENLKGEKLNPAEKKALLERASYTKKWIEDLAPDQYTFTILKEAPSDLTLDADQKETIIALKEALADPSLPWEGPAIHEAIHAVKEKTGIAPKNLFQPLYILFLGRTSGPQVGWFLSTFERDNVLKRLEECL